MRRATKICKYVARRNVISIHALLAESDIYCHLSGASYSISIHALLAESDIAGRITSNGTKISIHALLAESDKFKPPVQAHGKDFYPRSPCGERPAPLHMCHRVETFLSTLSLRRATAPPAPQGKSSIFLSTLSLRRATRETVPRGGHIIFLSTLSLRRATGCQRPCARPTRDFYPRSPCGERRELNSN